MQQRSGSKKMRAQKTYFVLNKNWDFQRGNGDNIRYLDMGISIKEIEKTEGKFFSKIYDSKEKQMPWHRMTVAGTFYGEASVIFQIYAGDSKIIIKGKEEYDVEDILSSKSLSMKEKEDLFLPFLQKTAYEPKDILLHQVTGRYLWFQIRLLAQGEASPEIYKIKMYFPKESWMQYLPEIYQREKKSASFVERYLGIYQSIYEDMTEKINNATSYFDFEAVNGELLQWLASWINIDDSYIWTDKQLHELLLHGMEWYRMRGTTSYLLEVVKLYTGRTPYIVESYQIEGFCKDKQKARLLTELYGDNPYIFTVIVDLGTLRSNKEYRILRKVVENAKPAHIESNIVLLEPYIFLDKHSYLGINSVLGQYRAVILDGQGSIPFTKIESHRRK
ncbi:MAG: phage tail protein [Acetivibrio sp.]